MDAKTYCKVSLINVAFLVIGIMFGLLLARTNMIAYAQNTKIDTPKKAPSSLTAR
jgi:hypothetical protein